MKINEKRLKIFALFLAVTFAIQTAASFYTYGAISNVADPTGKYFFDWVWYTSLSFYGIGGSLIWLAIMQKEYDRKKGSDEFSLIFYATPWVAFYFILKPFVWPSISWIEGQVFVAVPNARIAWTLVLGVYLGVLCLCGWWVSTDGQKQTN